MNKPLNVTGAITATGISQFSDVNIPDNNAIRFGNSQDLQIYHDGTDSFISDQGTGNLKILANDFRLANAANNELMIAGNQSGAVTAYYAGAAKLATTTSGIDVTGTVTATGVGGFNDYIDLNTSGNRGKIGYDNLNLYLGSTSSTGEIPVSYTHLTLPTILLV